MITVSSEENATSSMMPQGRGARLLVALLPRQFQGLVLQVREDWRTHYQDWTLPGFRAVAAHRFGAWIQAESGRGVVRGPVRYVLGRLHLAMFRYVRNQYGIELPHKVKLGRRVLVGHQSGIVIHEEVTIGDDCIIRQNVTLGLQHADNSGVPTLGRGVELGTGSTIVGPVIIGDGARIGPHALVMTDVPAGASVFVNPPRMITLRSVTPGNGPTVAAARESQPAAAAR
jgi:serine O-acetyltransferase